ncbi:MAG: hypothetical protein IJK46_05315 [Prevotella sp.]|nr:hypothetical protein [Prevotella sp.]
MNKTIAFPFVALLMLMATSCTSRLTDFTVISTKNVPLGDLSELKKAPVRVKGKDMASMILIVPTGVPNLKEAIDKAIEQYPGAVALADGVVKSKFVDFLLYGRHGYIVEGTPLYPVDVNGNIQTSNNQQQQVQQQSQQSTAIMVFHDVELMV